MKKSDEAIKQLITGAKSLSDAIDVFKAALAQDITRVSNGEDGLTVLSSNNDDKVYKKILQLIVMFDNGKPVALPKIETEINEPDSNDQPSGIKIKKAPITIAATENPYETAINHIKTKNGHK